MPSTRTRRRGVPRALPSLRALRQAVFASPREDDTWGVTCMRCGPVQTGVSLARARWTVTTHTCPPEPAVPGAACQSGEGGR